ncbi:hypothetical protein [Pedobacter psychroterrae]|uniref:Uncharacterized protein n=1 Tax=Pedobacter psychroterrae TaxID=2530453 RepID=A0A4R0NGZ9_9SPHI|nr:hypothetical protein [Pedobacter psychroterrae]TCC99831.1 hypothetical protein EZ437_16445 [Pedobacter psychroterrae]
MARIIGKYLKGVLGDSVLKTYGNMQIIQARPVKGKSRRAEGSDKSSSLFGIASNIACEFRTGVSKLVTAFYDGTMIFRLNTEVAHALRYANNPETGSFNLVADSFSRLEGFDFNAKSPLVNTLVSLPQVEIGEHSLTVSLPALEIPKNLKFPKDTKFCRMLIGRSLTDLTNQKRKIDFVSFEIENKKGTTIPQSWEFETQAGCVCILVVSLQFIQSSLAGEAVVNSKTFNPAAILKAVVLKGQVDKTQTKGWSGTMTKKILLG